MRYIFTALVCSILLSACADSGRYHTKYDSPPDFHYGELDLSDAIPRYEPYNPANLRPYQVFGRYYTPMLSAKGFVQEGQASWYGQKFHGHTTSNGETYDMFAMTAAHKRLPLPSYVKVTNLDNDKTAIVRVNDRGPFHPGRVIDLSYAAAKKLDVISTGVANVKLELVHVDASGVVTVGNSQKKDSELVAAPATVQQVATIAKTETPPAITPKTTAPAASALIYVQVAAISDSQRARSLATNLANLLQVNATAPKIDELYRLRLGPIKSEPSARKLIQELAELDFQHAFMVMESP